MKYLIEALGAWGVPVTGLISLAIIFLIMQVSGEIIEWTGKVSPRILKLRKVFKERKMKKLEQQAKLARLDDFINVMNDVNSTLTSINAHYSEDCINQRNDWIAQVNENIRWTHERATVYDNSVADLMRLQASAEKLSEFTCKQIKENYRNRILDFQHRIINSRNKLEPERFSHEEFAKIYATYDDYEEFLEYTHDQNHQVDNAMETIGKAERGELPECYNIEFTD